LEKLQVREVQIRIVCIHTQERDAAMPELEIGNYCGGGTGCKVKGVIITHLISALSKLVFCMI
jgi:hypothetical protein